MEDEEIIYSTFDYLFVLFTFKPILDTILSYYINKFKDKKNNLLLFYNITFSICLYLALGTSLNFLPRIKRHIDITEYMALVFLLFLILDLIVTAIFFKKNKKTFITFLSIAFLLFISCIIFYTYVDDGYCELFLDINDYIIGIIFNILFILKTVFSSIYTVYLVCKSIIKLKKFYF